MPPPAPLITGLSRDSLLRTAVSKSAPSDRCRLIVDTSTNPFNTATPDNAMKPTPAEIENGISRTHRASTPPTAASGTPVNIKIASLTDEYVQYNSPKINSNAMAMTIASRPRSLHILKPAKSDKVSRFELVFFADAVADLIHKRADVPPADIVLHTLCVPPHG
jgi:hypothetical protein